MITLLNSKKGRLLGVLLLMLYGCQFNEDNVQMPNNQHLSVIVSPESQKLSLAANHVSLEMVLIELSKKMNIELIKNQTFNELISIEFKDINLTQALKLLLKQESYSLTTLYSSDLRQLHYQLRITSTHRYPDRSVTENSIALPSEIEYQSKLIQLESLPNVPPQQAISVYRQALSTPHVAIKLKAMELLSEVNDPQIVAIISEQLTQQETTVQIHALQLLGEIQDPSVLPQINQLLFNYPTAVRLAAISALGSIANSKSIAPLSVLVTDPDPLIRLRIISALDNIGGIEVIPLLQLLSQDSNIKVQNSALALLDELEL